MKKIAIIGTRRRDKGSDQKAIEKQFFEIYEEGDWIISGGCPKGGDRFAEIIAKQNGIPILIFYPNYKKFGRYNAPKERNTDVAKIATDVIACVMNPEDGFSKIIERQKGGTEDTIKKWVAINLGGPGRIYFV